MSRLIIFLAVGVFAATGCTHAAPTTPPSDTIKIGMSGSAALDAVKAAGGQATDMDMAPPRGKTLQCFELADGRAICLVFEILHVSAEPGGTDSSVVVLSEITVCDKPDAPKADREWKKVNSLDLMRRRAASQPAASQPDIGKLIADLSSDDGKARVAATRAIFAMGKDASEPLAKAGAKQITPLGPATGRRIDMVYSLLDGFKPNRVGVPRGYHTADYGFKLLVEKGCTVDDVKKMGERQGFTIPWNFDRNNHVFVGRGKTFEGIIRDILTSEPQAITVDLIYYEITP